MIRRPPRSTLSSSSAASDVYKRQKGKSVTDAQYEQAKLAYQASESQYVLAKREYNDTKVTTPISGIVTARIVDLGNYVTKNSVVANVVDISKLKVKLNVAEKDAFKLKTGDNVEIRTDVYAGIVFNGKISSCLLYT